MRNCNLQKWLTFYKRLFHVKIFASAARVLSYLNSTVCSHVRRHHWRRRNCQLQLRLKSFMKAAPPFIFTPSFAINTAYQLLCYQPIQQLMSMIFYSRIKLTAISEIYSSILCNGYFCLKMCKYKQFVGLKRIAGLFALPIQSAYKCVLMCVEWSTLV